MGNLKRALVYLQRKKGRSILLILILFILASILLTGFSMVRSAEQENQALQQSLGSSFVLKADLNNSGYYEPRVGDGYSYQIYVGPMITEDIIKEISGIEGVVDSFTDSASVMWTNVELKPAQWTASKPSTVISSDYIKIRKQVTTLFHCEKGEHHPYFENGAFKIIEGRNIQETDRQTAVISDEVASRNHLGLKDKILIKNRSLKNGEVCLEDQAIELEIVGIFHVNFYQEITDFTSEDAVAENFIFTDMDTEVQIRKNSGQASEKEYTKAVFYVDSPDILDSVMENVKDKIHLNGLLMEKDDSGYAAAVKPYQQVGTFTKSILVSVVIGCFIILSLLQSLWMKSRKKEVGILFALGIGKRSVWVQFLVENIMAAGIAFVLACVFAGPFSGKIGDLAEDMVSPEAGTQRYEIIESQTANIEIQQIASEKIQLDTKLTAPEISAVALLTTLVSVADITIAIRKYTRENPKQLLNST
ncbi:MAG TPA: ABC transporter permease [Candidatus Scatomonas pullistercoris]|uniref:ABC transporter permease n=1 Tax=Candidatus Scatomonas pullistercoris TaxID=2840920 RepID=A0A9D1P1J4_9FIRM|nr:ABC transporter permease [Candidatus Scatomonas pullistercoris]